MKKYNDSSRMDLIDLIEDLCYENDNLRDKVIDLEQELKTTLKLKECK